MAGALATWMVHLRMAGYRLLTAKDVWLRLATNLRLIDDPDARLRAHARADIATWLDRQAATTYRSPSRPKPPNSTP